MSSAASNGSSTTTGELIPTRAGTSARGSSACGAGACAAAAVGHATARARTIAVDPCTPEDEEGLGLDPGESAVRVTAVFAGGLGEKYFEVGDLVYRWNGAPLAEDDPAGRFNAFVGAARKGDRITIRYARGKERKAALVQF